jgi:hypothetical protein
MRRFLAGVASGLALAAASPALASTTVDLRSGYSTSGQSLVYTAGAIDFSVTALTYTGAFSAAQTPTVSRPVRYDQGLGVNPTGDNRHTVDNSGAWDFLLFRFDTPVAITGAFFSNGNWYNDGTADTDASLSFASVDLGALGQTYSTSLVNGAVTSFFSAATKNQIGSNIFASNTATSGNSTRTFNAGLQGGNTWLIGASVTSTGNVDSFKLKSITFQTPVPEPSTWALLILGFGGVGAAMRRRKQQALAIA